MLFRGIIAVYCENHTEHVNTLCEQNAEFYCVKAGGTYSNHPPKRFSSIGMLASVSVIEGEFLE
jgi:hypothetical protein